MKKLVYALMGAWLLILLLTSGEFAFAGNITFIKEYSYKAGEIDSKLTCRAIALEQTKRLLLEELGTYLISETSVKNYEISKDQITTLTAGLVMTSILDEQWDGNTYYLKAKIVADPQAVARAIDVLRKDKEERLELEVVKKKNEAAMLEIEKLRNELSKHGAPESRRDEYSVAVSNLSSNDLFYTGFAYLKEKKYREAIKTFDKAIEISPNNPEAYINRGIAYEQLGLYDKALGDYRDALKRSGGSPRISVMCGLLYEKKREQAEKVLAEYDTAIQKDHLYEDAYYRKGKYFLKLSGYEPETGVGMIKGKDGKYEFTNPIIGAKCKDKAAFRKSIDNYEIAAKLGHKIAIAELKNISNNCR